MNKKLTAKIKSLPQKPGVYLFKDTTGRILYIGKAVNLRNRVHSHFNSSSQSKFNPPAPPFAKGGLGGISDLDFILTANEKEALILENELIKKYAPKYNIQWRDDKSYFWVSFTNDVWPRVQVVHDRQALSANRHSKSRALRYAISDKRQAPGIGPFTNGRELKQVLRRLRKILPYRTCKNAYNKPCLQWHLGLCPAHKSINNKQSTINNESLLNTYHLSLKTLLQLLRLYAGEPIRIEAYDISNIQGTSATGSMIVFKGFKSDKSQYRKFRIKHGNSYGRVHISRVTRSGTSERLAHAANDVAMLKEVLRRRLNHKEWPLPDLMLIDGGRTQLNTIAPLTQRGVGGLNIPTLALAKKEEEFYTIYNNKTLRLNALPMDLRLLFQAIRNEAHRFAISYYRKLHRRKISNLPPPSLKRKGKNQFPSFRRAKSPEGASPLFGG